MIYFSKKSFTIVELLIAMGVFMFLMVATFGIYTVAIQRHYDAQKSNAVNQELRYAIELMSRDIKNNRLKKGDSTGIYLLNQNKLSQEDFSQCSLGNVNACWSYGIDTSTNVDGSPGENNGIWARYGSSDIWTRLTSQDIQILSKSRFYVDASSADQDNPKVTIFIEAKEKNDKKDISKMYLQTTATQKELEKENVYE